ncbi:BRO1 domain-containing protein BROX-like [Neocloeon triangulifer]|uniref:BRO1 domain-containing protein BROX-like n=1 Tax=Neocloeon triangulifer TaxID=2078957 RepID=UPI00286F4749|nr:BRO1 domain-containing protein BROX-like [Neocloeon triangulifer]
MAHWFHRNLFKATTVENFDLKMVALDTEALKICGDLKQCRKRLLELIPDANHSGETIDSIFNSYLSLAQGFLKSFDGDSRASKMRHSIIFKWTHTLLGSKPYAEQDFLYEVANITMNIGIWYMKHASMIAGKDDITMDEAKEVHTSMRKAAGAFQFVTQELIPDLVSHGEPGMDTDPRVAGAYLAQCTAEAQEVTVARAMELKHNAALISALSNETAKLFLEADNLLNTLNPKVVGQWKTYMQIKAAFYTAYAYMYCGENCLTLEKGGDAVRACQESKKYYDKALTLSKEYSKMKGPAKIAKPEQHLFFRKLLPMIQRALEKCERENGFIYHQKVPYDPPQLEMKATYGLAKPEPVTMPAPSPLWNPASYAAFDTAMASARDPKLKGKSEGELPEVKEASVHQSGVDPKNESGCFIQ